MSLTTVFHQRLFLVSLSACALSLAGCARKPAELNLIQEGNKYVGEQSKNKVVEIRSDQSVGSLTPEIWYVVYYDPAAALKATEVKFGDGKEMDVSHPLRILQYLKADNLLDTSKINVGSARAIQTATSDSLLQNLTLKATQLWLDPSDQGPQWKVRLWAAKLRNPNDLADIGDIYISAESGEVVRRDLHIDRVN